MSIVVNDWLYLFSYPVITCTYNWCRSKIRCVQSQCCSWDRKVETWAKISSIQWSVGIHFLRHNKQTWIKWKISSQIQIRDWDGKLKPKRHWRLYHLSQQSANDWSSNPTASTPSTSSVMLTRKYFEVSNLTRQFEGFPVNDGEWNVCTNIMFTISV